jgi:hypothetical protein
MQSAFKIIVLVFFERFIKRSNWSFGTDDCDLPFAAAFYHLKCFACCSTELLNITLTKIINKLK